MSEQLAYLMDFFLSLCNALGVEPKGALGGLLAVAACALLKPLWWGTKGLTRGSWSAVAWSWRKVNPPPEPYVPGTLAAELLACLEGQGQLWVLDDPDRPHGAGNLTASGTRFRLSPVRNLLGIWGGGYEGTEDALPFLVGKDLDEVTRKAQEAVARQEATAATARRNQALEEIRRARHVARSRS